MSNTVSDLPDMELQIFISVVSLGGGSVERIHSTVQQDGFDLNQYELTQILQYLEKNSLLTHSDDEYSVSDRGRSEFRKFISEMSDSDSESEESTGSSHIETPDNPFVKLTSFQRDMLGTLWYGETQSGEGIHGLALQEALTEQYGKDIHHGRLYPNLDTLVDKGLVEKSRRDRRTNNFSITLLGREVLKQYDEFTSFEIE